MAEFALRRTTGEGWTYVAEPKSSFKEWGEETFAGDGDRTELGYVDILWDYASTPLSGLEMYQLLSFCSGASANIQVRTKTNEVTAAGNQVFRNYRAVMYRPEVEFHRKHGINQEFINVKVRFRGSEEVT